MIVCLALKALHETIYFSADNGFIQGHKQIRGAEVSVILGDFILPNQLVTKGIPS